MEAKWVMGRAALSRVPLGACALALLLAGCGGNGAGFGGPRSTESPACTALAGTTVDAGRIGLPTRGATVSSAATVPASPGGGGPYCQVEGRIHAVDAGTPDIRFRLNLPAQWNGKALQMGGKGYNGILVPATGQIDMAPFREPLALGYATFGSDSGHVGNEASAEFALDDEALLNFAWQHLKKTRDVATELMRRRYGEPPRRTYFGGASSGGREGLTAIQRFPADYDGVVAVAPSLSFTGVRLMGVKVGRASYRNPGGFLPRSTQALLRDTGIRECDGLDGLADGLVSDVAACRARAEATLAGLRCPRADGPCLSDAQIATVRLLHEGYTLPYALAHGRQGYPGYNILEGTDFSGPLGLGESPTVGTMPGVQANGYLFAQGDAYMKYFVSRDPDFDTLAFDVENPGALQQRIVELSGVVGATNPDLREFAARGGKLILMHGLADEVISPDQTIDYYQTQVRLRGQAETDRFIRFYTVPGFGHGGGRFVPFWDALGALDRWVERGEAPGTLEAIDIAAATQGRKRPMCLYPAFPAYRGAGSPDEASSFACTRR
ncbi:tannase/feruloyl esterase family alpha/beta hydrolase [Caldimonas tepidiphila]|uniref:tannase/feruloyl esterase family alpha/beta hydrolase n=1 Tax=Caldimonas tepidiphila TaxID=2315841 RepID=UPI000E5AFB4A|nr:tannase/feruloyl esterase family alpha/beta hydrolase [Caldimonas tepidiphila]